VAGHLTSLFERGAMATVREMASAGDAARMLGE
jgi:hypothetical protein